MDWGKVVFIFFTLMSLTSTAGFLYDENIVVLFIAASVNVISTVLKMGVKNLLSAEMMASSLVADLHLIPAFIYLQFFGDHKTATALVIGALIANIFSAVLVFIESAKSRDIEL